MLLVVVACEGESDKQACVPGSTRTCQCSSRSEGVQVCDRTGSKYGDCVCGNVGAVINDSGGGGEPIGEQEDAGLTEEERQQNTRAFCQALLERTEGQCNQKYRNCTSSAYYTINREACQYEDDRTACERCIDDINRSFEPRNQDACSAAFERCISTEREYYDGCLEGLRWGRQLDFAGAPLPDYETCYD